jgi:hypothetical protein
MIKSLYEEERGCGEILDVCDSWIYTEKKRKEDEFRK